MNNKHTIQINGESYSVFASENVKRLLLRNKLSVIDVISAHINRPFTKIGDSKIQNIDGTNLCVLNIKAFDIDLNEEVKCFILHCVGNYSELIPISSNKWSVKLNCGHKAVIDETVSPIDKDHYVECYICQKEQCMK